MRVPSTVTEPLLACCSALKRSGFAASGFAASGFAAASSFACAPSRTDGAAEIAIAKAAIQRTSLRIGRVSVLAEEVLFIRNFRAVQKVHRTRAECNSPGEFAGRLRKAKARW